MYLQKLIILQMEHNINKAFIQKNWGWLQESFTSIQPLSKNHG